MRGGQGNGQVQMQSPAERQTEVQTQIPFRNDKEKGANADSCGMTKKEG
jgi:hypothetical protein